MAQRVRGENLAAGSPLPIDHAISLLQDSPDVAFCLLPKLSGHGVNKRKAPSSGSSAATKTKKTRQKKRQKKKKTPTKLF